MKRVCIAATMFAFMSIPYWVWAQEDKKIDKETEEIVIRKSGDKVINLKLEITGDKIIVNGKPLAEFKDDQITINKRKMIVRDGDKMMAFDFGPGGRTFNMGDGFMKDWSDDKEESTAFLGVTSEKTDDGAKITEVIKGSAAEKAGLKKDDIISKVGDEKVEDAETLSEIISSKKPKDEIKIFYNRNGKENNVKATLGGKKGTKSIAFSFKGPHGMARSFSMPKIPNGEIMPEMNFEDHDFGPYAGMENDFPRQKKLGLQIQDTEEGANVKVIDVEEGSAAEKAGLKKDDIIIEIGGKKINNTDDAREQLHTEESKSSYNIKARRNGSEMSFDVKIPKKLKTANL